MVLKDFRKRLSVLKNRIWPDWSDEEYVHQRFHTCNQGSALPLILYAGLGSDYGRPGLGIGYDTVHFYYSLVHGGYPAIHFPYDAVRAELGRERTQSVLRLACLLFRPSLLFHAILDDELTQETVRSVSSELGIPTVAFFSDDHWRFDNFSRNAAKPYDWQDDPDLATDTRQRREQRAADEYLANVESIDRAGEEEAAYRDFLG